MPTGILDTAYEALERGDAGPLLDMLGDGFEWVEPELPGYPLAGVHRGRDGVAAVLARLGRMFDGLVIEWSELADAGSRVTVTGTLRGRPRGADGDWELPFAHVWEVEDGKPVRVRAYFDRSRLTIAAARRELADAADDLLAQAGEIRAQWAKLGEALRGAGLEVPDEAVAAGEGLGDSGGGGAALRSSARLAAVDMASEGASRDEVEAYLRDELEVDEPAGILDEVFGAGAGATPDAALDERAAALEATRLSRLFARNRG
jgi:ketosteroid isomerase-like protein